jgi:hypothetical protein
VGSPVKEDEAADVVVEGALEKSVVAGARLW